MGRAYGNTRSGDYMGDCSNCGAEYWGDYDEGDFDETWVCPGCERYERDQEYAEAAAEKKEAARALKEKAKKAAREIEDARKYLARQAKAAAAGAAKKGTKKKPSAKAAPKKK
jgi:hypothetical protein